MLAQPRHCAARNAQGEPCRQPPLLDGDHCFWHDAAHANEAAAARQLGGQRRRREGAISGAYAFNGLETVADIRRLLEVATIDVLGLETSIAKARALSGLAMAAWKLLSGGEYEQRIASLEAAVHPQRLPAPSVFERDADEDAIVFEPEPAGDAPMGESEA